MDFRIDVTDAHGQPIDVLEYSRVPPAAYWFVLGDSIDSLAGPVTVRFVYDDAVVMESRVSRE